VAEKELKVRDDSPALIGAIDCVDPTLAFPNPMLAVE
jgi:hypothetical protein